MKIDKKGPDDCWKWQSAKDRDGYGFISLKGRPYYAHRVSYCLAYGEPGPIRVLHECNNPPCCNPNHLYLGTQAENVKKSYLDRRVSREGEFSSNAHFYNEEVIKIRKRHDEGESQISIAQSLGVSPEVIYQIVNYRTYKKV